MPKTKMDRYWVLTVCLAKDDPMRADLEAIAAERNLKKDRYHSMSGVARSALRAFVADWKKKKGAETVYRLETAAP